MVQLAILFQQSGYCNDQSSQDVYFFKLKFCMYLEVKVFHNEDIFEKIVKYLGF